MVRVTQSHKSSEPSIRLKLISKAGPSQDSDPSTVFTIVGTSPGAEEKLKALMEEVGPEFFQAAKKEEGEDDPEAQFQDADSDSSAELEPVEEEKQETEAFTVPVVAMPVFDAYGLPKDGFNYYQFIKSEVSGGDFIPAEEAENVFLARDSDFSHALNPQEQAVLAALDHASDYDSLSSDFIQEAAAGPSEDQDFQQVAEDYEADQPEAAYPRHILKGKALNALMDDFKKEYPDMLEEQKAPVEPVMEMPTRIEYEQDHLLRKLEEMEEEETGDQIAEKAFARLTYREPEEKDDVESVVSTYTNTDNRPAVISVSTAVKRTARATSQPEAVSSEPQPASKPVSTALPIPADETKEEKKARKAAIKTAKKEKRVQKKELKESFKSEKAKQVQQTSGTYDTPQGYSVVKIN